MKRAIIYHEKNRPQNLSQPPGNWLLDIQAANIFTQRRPNEAALPEICIQSLLSPQNQLFFTSARLEEISGNRVLLSALLDHRQSGTRQRLELFYILLE